MPEHTKEKKPKLENYLAYGMVFGLVGGVVVSLIGKMVESVFFKWEALVLGYH